MLSSSEADYIALSEAEKAAKFTFMLLKIMSLGVKPTINARVYNVGAIFMSENVPKSNGTKHVDTRYRFVNEFVEDRFIEIILVKTKDNVVGILPKNKSGMIGNRHHNKTVKDIEIKQEGY